MTEEEIKATYPEFTVFIYEEIGNAVPPNFARAILKQILKETVSVA